MGYRKFATQGVLGGKKVIKFGNFTAFGGLKLSPAFLKHIGIDGLVTVKRRKDLTVQSTPFGWVDQGGTAFIRGAPVAKMETVESLEKTDVGRAIVGGLRKAVEISRAHVEEGVALVNIRGRLKLMPRKAAEMMAVGARKELIVSITPVG